MQILDQYQIFHKENTVIKMDQEKVIFVLGDKLPTIYDAALGIYSVAQGPNMLKMQYNW